MAQSAPKDKAAQASSSDKVSAPATVEGVTVTGAAEQDFKSSIDRRSYGIAKDLQAATGSIGDALRNIPSVSVDLQGRVGLRGDQNVTIMIDGKPATLFQGPGAGQVIQSMPANQFERVEVIANPSAALSPDGTGGIINLITKKTHAPGRATSLRANLGSSGRRNLSLTTSYSSNDLTVSTDVALRHDPLGATATDLRSSGDPALAQAIVSRDTFGQAARLDFANVHLSADYDLRRDFRISGDVRHAENWFLSRSADRFEQTGPSASDSVAYDRDGEVRVRRNNDAIAGTLKRGSSDDHQVIATASYEETNEDRKRRYASSYLSGVGQTEFRDVFLGTVEQRTRATLEDNRDLRDNSRLSVGYEFQLDDNKYANTGIRGASPLGAGPDPGQTDTFLFKQTLNAIYATYEQSYGNWKLLTGLRLEDVRLDLHQATLNATSNQRYSGIYPSSHLEYRLSQSEKLHLSVVRRIQRPNATDYDPFQSYDDQNKFVAGNPGLKPQTAWSYEAGYQYQSGGNYYAATIYYQDKNDVVSDFASSLGDNILLITKDNIARSRSVGLELVANGRISKRLSYNVSGNTYWSEVYPSAFGLERREGVGISSRITLNFSPNDKDLLQANLFLNGKQLTLQGSQEPAGGVNLGYRHQFDSKLSVVITAQDVFASWRDLIIIDTPTLKDRLEGRPAMRAVFVGVAYNFGGGSRKPPDPGFDYGASSPR